MLRLAVFIILQNQLQCKVLTKYNKRHNEVRGDDLKDVLAEITRMRLKRKWSEYELAQHAGLSQSTISTWYRKNQVPTIQTLEKVCCGFGISLSQFFAADDDVVDLTAKQKELLDCWSALTDTQQALFLELFKNIP